MYLDAIFLFQIMLKTSLEILVNKLHGEMKNYQINEDGTTG